MEPDQMPPMERAWTCAGYRTVDTRFTRVRVLAPEGMVPLLALPPGLDAEAREAAHGWAMPELYRQRFGWLALLRALVHYDEIARIGAASGQGFAAD